MASARSRRYTTVQAMEFVVNYNCDEMTRMWPYFVCVPRSVVSVLCGVSALRIVSICLFVCQ